MINYTLKQSQKIFIFIFTSNIALADNHNLNEISGLNPKRFKNIRKSSLF